MRVRSRRLSANRVFVSKAQLKHMSDKTVITSNVYDAHQKFLSKKLNRFSKILNKLGKKVEITEIPKKIKNLYIKKFYLMRNICLQIFRKTAIRNKFLIQQAIKNNKLSKKTLLKFYLMLPQYNNLKKKYINFILKRYLKFLKKEMYALHFINLICFQKSKLYKTTILNHLIEKIYNRKIEFNFINLKYMHLNSDIFGEFLILKLRKQKKIQKIGQKKRNLRSDKILNKALNSNSLKIPFIHKLYEKRDLKNSYKALTLKKIGNFNISSFFFIKKRKIIKNKDFLNSLLKKIYLKNNNKYKIFNNIENKAVKGVRLKIKGRMSARLSAQRSSTKIKNKGSLKNINSSYKGLSSVALKGYSQSNVQYMKKNSVTRTGSFGLKI